MSNKLGYTFYPKDWGNSESVFELNLAERGLYRELIDLAMLNDNKTEVKKDVWTRKFAVTITELNKILEKLLFLKLIEIKSDKLFVPSCENRLNLVRGGKKGGSKNKPIPKPIVKPFESLCLKNEKPIAKQIEIETKIEKEIENKNNIFLKILLDSESWIEVTAMQSQKKFTKIQVIKYLKDFVNSCDAKFDFKPSKKKLAEHFVSWLNLQDNPENGRF